MQSKFGIADNHRVAGIGASALTDNKVCVLRQNIYYFSLALISPLQSNNAKIHISISN